METISDIRKAIKPLGFNIKTKSLSWGKHAIYFHIDTKKDFNFNVFTPESLKFWKTLIDWRKNNNEELKKVRENEDCRGLV